MSPGVMKGKTWQEKRTHCKQGHPYDEANTYISAKGWRYCRACRRDSKAKRWRQDNPIPWTRSHKQQPLEISMAADSDAYKKRRVELARTVIGQLKNRPCADCGNVFHFCAMDFDHLDDDAPKRSMSKLLAQGAAVEVIIEEAAKCEVVCSNCHRVRTFNRARARKRQSSCRMGMGPVTPD